MSIWCSRICLGDDVFPEESPAPIVYQRSHVLPRPGDARGGSVDTAHIPGFLTYDGYDDAGDGEEFPWWPYLRLSVRPERALSFEAWKRLKALTDTGTDLHLAKDIGDALTDHDADTVVLDLAQVDALIDDLTEWRANVRETL